jgi:hypothetical protein
MANENPYILAAQKRLSQTGAAADEYADNPFLKMVAGNKMSSYEPGATDWRGKEMPVMPDYVQSGGFQYQKPNLKRVDRPDLRKNPETGELSAAGASMGATRPAEVGGAPSGNAMDPKSFFYSLFPAGSLKELNPTGLGNKINSMRIEAMRDKDLQSPDNPFNNPFVARALTEVQTSKLNDAQKRAMAVSILENVPKDAYGQVKSGSGSDKEYSQWKSKISQEGQKNSASF